MPFLRLTDYDPYIKRNVLEQVRVGEDWGEPIRQALERAVLEGMRSKLRGRYDEQAVFALAPAWDILKQYTVKDVVTDTAIALDLSNIDQVKYYRVIPYYVNGVLTPPPIGTVVTNTTYWEYLMTGRNPALVKYMVQMVLYDLMKRVSGDQVGQHWKAGYDEAMMWLEAARDGKDQPDLPNLPLDSAGRLQGDFVYGSVPKTTTFF